MKRVRENCVTLAFRKTQRPVAIRKRNCRRRGTDVVHPLNIGFSTFGTLLRCAMHPRFHVATYVTLMLLTPRLVRPAPWIQRRGQCGECVLEMCVCVVDELLSAVWTSALQGHGVQSTHACTQTYWRAGRHQSTSS